MKRGSRSETDGDIRVRERRSDVRRKTRSCCESSRYLQLTKMKKKPEKDKRERCYATPHPKWKGGHRLYFSAY